MKELTTADMTLFWYAMTCDATVNAFLALDTTGAATELAAYTVCKVFEAGAEISGTCKSKKNKKEEPS